MLSLLRTGLGLCLLLGSTNLIHAQWKLESLTGPNRPPLNNPDSLVTLIHETSAKLLRKRIGNACFEAYHDTSYRYPHYYNNVYFNSAPSERNYRHFIRLKFAADLVYNIELVYHPQTLAPLFDLREILPNCKTHPKLCNLLSREEALQRLRKPNDPEGSLNFGFHADVAEFRFIYEYHFFTQYPYGTSISRILDASSGKQIGSDKIQENMHLGR